LKHTQQWQDSVAALEKAAKAVSRQRREACSQTQFCAKVIFGVAAAGAAVAGVLVDNMVKGKINNDATIKNEYVSLDDPSRANEYRQKLNDNLNQAKSSQTTRNICYGLAGACIIGSV